MTDPVITELQNAQAQIDLAVADAINRINALEDPIFAGYTLPVDTQDWSSVYKAGMSVQQVMDAAAGSILVLPPAVTTFPADETNMEAYDAALRIPKGGSGLAGRGIGYVLQPAPNSFVSRPGMTNSAQKMIDTDPKSVNYLGGFTILGQNFPNQVYNCTLMSGPGAIVEHMRFIGAHRGLDNKPPLETGAITTYLAPGIVIRWVDIDCLNVGSSPIMLNDTDSANLSHVWARNANKGSVTNYKPSGVSTYQDVHSVNNDNGFNFERAAVGTVIHLDDCEFKPKDPVNGAHLQVNGDYASAKVIVTNPNFNGDKFRVRLFKNYPPNTSGANQQQKSDIMVVDKNGNPLTVQYV